MEPTPTAFPRAPLSFPRKLLYAAILTVFTFALLLGALELVLRLTGHGHSPDFVRREKLPDGSVIFRENRDFAVPFFSEQLVRRPQPFRLSAKKSPGTIRIFVLGSSAAMGDPEASFSIARLLEVQLRAAYPENKFEVINAAVTAINSHIVRGIAEDCAQLEPDLFVVYEGHNEVIGPFGPTGVFTASLRSEAAVRTAIWLKRTRTGQLLASLARRGESAPEKWGGMEMFLQHQIAADDPRLDNVRAHFRANLRAIVRSANQAGASAILCTTLANQRDFAPFLSLHRRDLTDAQLAEWDRLYREGNDAALAGDTARARSAYRAALEIDDRYAELPFRLARLNLATGETDGATRALFQSALDHDALRFRADSSLNAIIRDLPSSLPGKKVRVVDLQASTAAPDDPANASAPGSLAGNKLLYEHVHLTFLGAYTVTRELLPVIAAELHARGLVSHAQPQILDTSDIRQRLAFTAYEQALIFLELQNRFQRPPFTLQSDHAIRLDTTTRQLAAAQALLARPDATPALRAVYDHALSISPHDWVLHRNAGMMLLARAAPADALPYLEKAAAWIDDDVDTLLALARCYHALGRPTDAARVLDRARELEPRHPQLPASAHSP
jgi:tetratricopeptide (TPR) repeat protein